jgi:hypothetical protein
MEFSSDFKYDLKVGQVAEKELASVFQDKKIEVKTDLQAHKTGNVYVEYFSRGKPSGISTSESDFYCFALGSVFVLIESKELKEKCRKYLNTSRDKKGGDNNTSKGILLPVVELINQ